MHCILQIPETLSNILQCLPEQDIVRCQLVCRFWSQSLRLHFPPEKIPLPPSHGIRSANLILSTPSVQSIQSSRQHWASSDTVVHILSKLSFSDLLRCQSVCRAFYRAIHGSSALRQKMYLQPDWTPIAAEKLFTAFTRPQDDFMGYLDVKYAPNTHLHPLLLRYLYFPCYLIDGALGVKTPGKISKIDFLSIHALKFKALLDEDTANWRSMYVIQPPPTSVEVVLQDGVEATSGRDGVFWNPLEVKEYIRVENRKGVRLGEIFDELRGVVVQHQDIWFNDDNVRLTLFFDI